MDGPVTDAAAPPLAGCWFANLVPAISLRLSWRLHGAVNIIGSDSVESKSVRTALALSGPPGLGKTAVGWRVFDRCTDAGTDPALIDVDMVGAAWPAPEDDPNQTRLRAANLAAVWSNCQDSGQSAADHGRRRRVRNRS